MDILTSTFHQWGGGKGGGGWGATALGHNVPLWSQIMVCDEWGMSEGEFNFVKHPKKRSSF